MGRESIDIELVAVFSFEPAVVVRVFSALHGLY